MESEVQRRLAAIMVVDMVGYSRQMRIDEEGAFGELRAIRQSVISPAVEKHRGRIFKTAGDGFLAEFASVVDATRCAIDIQKSMAQRDSATAQVAFRIGINVGDVISDGEDVIGDGVNLAARLEALAAPGGICLSARAKEDIDGKLELAFEDLGEQSLKNIDRPVRVFHLRAATPSHQFPALPDKPSIAVLPFQNMSGDPEQDYFADGIVEEIIAALSRARWLFVIARNSSFAYRGRAVDIKQVGRELGVRYVLEGSVRKSQQKLRITGQLIDATNGAHIWAERFDGSLESVFDLQDMVTSQVVGAISPKLQQAEIDRVHRKPTGSLDAYDYYLRGLAEFNHWTRTANLAAANHFREAISRDPSFACAHGMLVRCYAQRRVEGWALASDPESPELRDAIDRAARYGRDDAMALCLAGVGLEFVLGDVARGLPLIDRALELDPNLAIAWLLSAWPRAAIGERDEAVARANRAIRLSPNDPQLFEMYVAVALAHFNVEDYAQAQAAASTALMHRPRTALADCILAACQAHDGRLDDAKMTIQRVLRYEPDLRLSNLDEMATLRGAEDRERWIRYLERAGLPK